MPSKEKVWVPLLIAQAIMIVLFCVFGTYQEGFNDKKYAMFQDVHVMIFLGFGYLMAFLKRYGYSSLGFTLLLGSFIIQWALICQGFYGLNETYKIELGIESMAQAEIAAAAFLISLGALIGRTSVTQLLVMGFIEVAIYCANLYIGIKILKVADAGGSIFVHTFGAYFGLAVSYVINRTKEGKQEVSASLQKSNYTSDKFAMIGTIFLWLYWPSFTAIDLEGTQQQRAVMNTYLALAASCLTTFAVSAAISSGQKFDMVHVQNSSLAGGVAIGTVVNLLVQPGGAMIIGTLAAVLSVLGYEKISPMLEERFKVPDVCGVHNLHGMPGVLSGVIGAIVAATATTSSYHDSLYEIYPARLSLNGTDSTGAFIEYTGRRADVQGWYQFAALVITMLIAIVSGLVTGAIVSWLSSVSDHEFDDVLYWELSEDEGEPKRLERVKKDSAPRNEIGQYNEAFEDSTRDGCSSCSVQQRF